MRRTARVILIAAVLAAPLAAQALMGFLVRWETSTSVTGRFVYVCYYDVMGTTQRVVLERMCPQTMEFQ